jgi:hypothetical protein
MPYFCASLADTGCMPATFHASRFAWLHPHARRDGETFPDAADEETPVIVKSSAPLQKR